MCVTAGLVRTEQSDIYYGDEAGIAAVGATIPLGRIADPADIGDVCVLLSSPMARYIDGASVIVDGGGERPAYLDASTAENVAPLAPEASERRGHACWLLTETISPVM